MILRSAAAMLLLVACLSSILSPTDSHGMVIKPMSRNYQSFLYDPMDVKTWNPTEGNGGGPKVVSDGGKLVWPEGKFDICGDPHNRQRKYFNYFRSIAETYVEGQAMQVHQLISANHEGRMILRVCPANVTTENYKQVCIELPRLGCEGEHCTHWTLPPGQGLDGRKRPLIPAYESRTFNWYIFDSQDDFSLMPVYVVHYKLPMGFTCDRCIIHWYWLTGNTCNPSCDKSDPLYPNCNRKGMGYCGDPAFASRADKYPEEFWSCSDVKILPKGLQPEVQQASIHRGKSYNPFNKGKL